jgi:hypothetical protein
MFSLFDERGQERTPPATEAAHLGPVEPSPKRDAPRTSLSEPCATTKWEAGGSRSFDRAEPTE